MHVFAFVWRALQLDAAATRDKFMYFSPFSNATSCSLRGHFSTTTPSAQPLFVEASAYLLQVSYFFVDVRKP